MNNLEIEIARPHYINRNEQFDRKEPDKPIRIKSERKTIPVQNIVAPSRAKSGDEVEAGKVRELKEWLLRLLTEAKNSWEQQLIEKKNMILLMKKGHRERLMKILQYIEGLRKKAYEEYRHVCDRSREECCTVCHQRGIFFNEMVKRYLKQKGEREEMQGGEGKGSSGIDGKEERHSIRKVSERNSASNMSIKQKRQSRYSNASDRSVESSNSQDFLHPDAQRARNVPFSKFKKGDGERISHKVSSDRNSQVDIKILLSEEREGGVDYRFNQIKKEDQESRRQSRPRKSGIPYNSQDSPSKMEAQSVAKPQDPNNKRTSRGSIRQSVLKQSFRGSYQQGQFPKGQFKLIDAEQAVLKKQSAVNAGRIISKFSLSRSSQNNNSDEVIQRSHKKKKTLKGRNNRYIKKNQAENMVEIAMTSSSDSDDDGGKKRERDEIESLLREKEFLRNENFKKISRYRRERMFYDVIKKEILLGEGQDIAEGEEEPKDITNTQYSSSHDYESIRETDAPQKSRFGQQKLKKYSLTQRKESLISKLAMLNDGNTFQSIKGKFQQILNQSGNMVKEDISDKNPKNVVEKFLSQVLKITDLKRLMKDKFFKEADWSPKMREMHQFYTYLEYSMEAFRSKLKKTAELGWKELSFQGKTADAKLDGLILDNVMRDWQGLQLSNIGEQHHREIECSMKYYGIDVKRLKNLNQLSGELSSNKSLNPIFSSVGQRSMKNIEQISDPIFIFP